MLQAEIITKPYTDMQQSETHILSHRKGKKKKSTWPQTAT